MGWDANFYLTENEKKLSEEVVSYIKIVYEDDKISQLVEYHGCSFASWYEDTRDRELSQLSIAFPKILFRLQIEDIDNHDQWCEYWLNGEKETIRPVITYKEPTLEHRLTLDVIQQYIKKSSELKKYSNDLENYVISHLKNDFMVTHEPPFNYKDFYDEIGDDFETRIDDLVSDYYHHLEIGKN